MVDYCNEIKNSKFIFLNKTLNSEEFDLKTFIIENGFNVFLFDGFNRDAFLSALKLFLHNELKFNTESISEEDEFVKIIFQSKKGLSDKFNIAETYVFTAVQEGKLLKFDVLSIDFAEKGKKKPKINPLSLISNSYRKKIISFVYEHIYSNYVKLYPERILDIDNVLIEKTSGNETILICELTCGEKIIGKLNFQSIKKTGEKEKLTGISSGFIVFSETKVFLVLLNKNNDITECINISKPIIIIKKFLKNSITVEDFTVFPKRSNSDFFNELPNIQKLKKSERIRKVAELNYLLKNYSGAKNIFRYLINREKNPFDEFLLFMSEYKEDKNKLGDFISDRDISGTLRGVLGLNEETDFLNKLFHTFNISLEDKNVFINLFSEFAETDTEQEKVIALYKAIRPKFFKKHKNLIKRTVFDIQYAEFLIKSGKIIKAGRLLKKILKHLPDETISDLLPPEDLDLTSLYSGQLLKVKILDLLAEAKGREYSAKEIQKSAVLQPLNEIRIERLLSVSKVRQRAKEALDLLNGKSLFTDADPVCKTTYYPLEEADIKKYLPYPDGTKKGAFYNLKKWISKIKEEDYSSVKKYSEKISAETHNTLFAVLKNTGEVFQLNNTEFYISKGNFKSEIVAFSGSPNFVLIGWEYTDKNASEYMNLSELRFSVAAELAHLYFNHTKLTSRDVWRGLIDKGAVFADAALAVIPAANVLFKAVQNVPRLNLLTKIFKGAATGISSSKTVYDTALRLSEYYGKLKITSKREKQQSLLAASRMMQYTADRAGLLLSGNLISAVRAIFLIGKFDDSVFKEIKQTSLKVFLMKQNNDGTYKYQETALRIANLFSFYFSEDFMILRKKIEKGR